ncbi:Hypothetical protein HVR_LOCUS1260 [uncultured virus]|nr:Hypothetical protein HVR_LOCUS1260 [uncultured virus]
MAEASDVSGVSTPEISTQAKQVFPVYLIHSGWSLSELDQFLEEFGGEDGGAGFLRIVYDSEGHETKRTVAILSDDLYNGLMADGCHERRHGRDFVVKPFELKENNFPGEGRTNSLFVPVPKDLRSEDRTVVSAISDKLQHLSEWNIVPAESWTVKPLLESREKGGIKGGCFISFKKEISRECRAMVRVLLTDTYWPKSSTEQSEENREVFHCFWARGRKDYKGQKSDKPSTEDDGKKAKDFKKERAIKNAVRKAVPLKEGKPVKSVQKKAPTVPVTKQPTLKKETENSE